jgi:hypothetical protein
MAEYDYTGLRVDSFKFLTIGNQTFAFNACRKVEITLVSGTADIYDGEESKLSLTNVGDVFSVEARQGFLLPQFKVSLGLNSTANIVFYQGEASETPKGK